MSHQKILPQHTSNTIDSLSDENARLRAENQALAALVRKPRVKRPRRYRVPVVQQTLFGVSVTLQLRAKDECRPWQWAAALLPMMHRVQSSLAERMSAEQATLDAFVRETCAGESFGRTG